MKFSADDRGITVAVGDSSRHFSWRWLRDHGEDPDTRNNDTQQRRINIFDMVVAPAIEVRSESNRICFEWSSKPSQTWISNSTFTTLLDDSPAITAELWRCASEASPTVGHVGDVLADDRALTAWLGDIDRWGFGLLHGFAGGHAEVDVLARRIGYPRATIFDPIWTLSADEATHDDTAYTHEYLAPHTDGTYSHDAPGLQMFACVERSGHGGESIVVDAFAVAEDLRAANPSAFELLCATNVPAHYIEPGVELRASRPAIRCNQFGQLEKISFNPYDRSPMSLESDQMEAFYDAYGLLQSLTGEHERQFAVRLEPGDVLIIDNWRALHGRGAYSGRRVFHGCYLNHEDFESRRRLLTPQRPFDTRSV